MRSVLLSHGLASYLWFHPGTPASSTNKTDRHDIDEILLKLVLNATTTTTLNIFNKIKEKLIQTKYNCTFAIDLLK
jgi:hypothetical protein